MAESTRPGLTPAEVIVAVVTDLDGLLTIDGLAQLLTAAPDEIVSFSDQPQFAIFHNAFSAAEMRQQIQQALDAGRLALSRHQRLVLPEQSGSPEF